MNSCFVLIQASQQPVVAGIHEPIYEIGKQKLGFAPWPRILISRSVLFPPLHTCASQRLMPVGHRFKSILGTSLFPQGLCTWKAFFSVWMFSSLKPWLTDHLLRGVSQPPSHILFHDLTLLSSLSIAVSAIIVFVHMFYLITFSPWKLCGVCLATFLMPRTVPDIESINKYLLKK